MTDDTQDLGNLNVDITVHQARELPDLKTWGGENREFYVSIDGGTKRKKKKKTRAMRSAGNTVDWEEQLGTLSLPPSSSLALTLHAKHRILPDIIVGTVEIHPVSKFEGLFVITTDSGPGPIIVLTVYVHGDPTSKQDDTFNFPEPAAVAKETISNSTPGSESKVEGQLILDVKASLNNANDAVEGINVCDEWKGVVENVQWVMQTVKDAADIHPYAEAAWAILSVIPEIFLAQFERDENIQTLVKSMREMFDLSQAEDIFKIIKPNSNQALILKVMLKHITICNDVIQRYAKDKEFVRRLFRNITGEISDEIQALCDTLTKLRRDFLDNAIINMQIAVHLIQQSMNALSNDIISLDFDAKINDLPYRSGWSSAGNKSGCLEGTRADFLEYILDWISDPTSLRGLILFGKLGTGKSSIAFEIASRFCFEERPGSYFSFVRAQRSKQADHYLLTTIIRDMSDRHPSFKLALGKLITNNTPLRTSDDFDQLFNILLLGPLQTVKATNVPDLIVIDGLDESGDPETLAKFLSRSLKQLPPNLRVLITSRSEGDIENCFRSVKGPPYKVIQMDDVKLAAKLEDDIRLYFWTHLSPRLFEKHGNELVKRADGLFQWAAVACGHLTKRPAGYTEKDCLRGLLGRDEGDRKFGQGLSTNLYSLYTEVLSAHFTPDKWNVVRPRFCSVMGQLLAVFESLSVNTLTGLRRFITDDDDYDDESVPAVVECMGSLLSNVTSGNHDLPVVPLHTSFRDFLTDETSQHTFSVDLIVTHEELTHACLGLMLYELTFNICQLESSHVRNTEVNDLQSRIEKFISPALFYACRLWDDHLNFTSFNTELLDKLELFFSNKFLAWLEVLSVTKTVQLAVEAIIATVKWLQSGLINVDSPEITDRIRELVDLVTDGLIFLRSFGKIIAMSAPHIYVSALPFAPSSSKIYKTYSVKFPPTVSFIQGQLLHWPSVELSITAHSLTVCVEFSPDGQWIACGLIDTSICLWNSTTGMLEGTRFIGHTKQVYSIAFHPNGQHILSSSSDHTIRLWNVATGAMVGEAWIGHENAINCIAFSPDGRYVASASRDCTVRIWDVEKGSMKGRPLTGHTKNVRAVAFSQDGTKFVSGSDDFTVCVWTFNAVQGTVQGVPITWSVPSVVSSVAFSPSSRQIAVGCFDKNVYIWDDLSGSIKGIPLTGHEFSVNSVKFSPDGRHLVSGSTDGKLLLWNTITKKVEGSPWIGPAGSVRSVAFSPDGQRIASIADSTIQVWNATSAKRAAQEGTIASTVHIGPVKSVAFCPISKHPLVASGSDDHTVSLWNIETGGIVGKPFCGHTGRIQSLAFSPDGQQLVSASADSTLRLWNVNHGKMEGTPLIGHTSAICAVCFSPDGRKIISGSLNGELLLWDIAAGTVQKRLPIGYSNPVVSMNFSSDGRQFVVGQQIGLIQLWDVLETGANMERRFNIRDTKVLIFVTFLSQGEQIFSCFIDGTASLWNSSTGEVQGTSFSLLNGSQSYVTSISSSSDNSHVAVAFNDCTITVWNLATHSWVTSLRPLVGHTGPVCSLAFSPNGHQIVSGSDDCTIRVWDINAELTTSHEEMPSNINLFKVDDEGWIRGRQGEFILWIPRVYMPALQRPRNTVAIFATYPIHLDFSRFLHGDDWYSIYSKHS